MTGMKENSEHMLNYIHSQCTEPVRDPVWGTIGLPEGYRQLGQHPLFMRLGRIRQLGPTHLAYPGAVHTRLNHSIGVFEIAKRMLVSLIRSMTGPGIWTPVGISSFLAAALLHDLGHFPYTHSLKDLSLLSHENLAARMILDDVHLRRILIDELHADPMMTAMIIDESIPAEDPQIQMYRTMLSGTLDPDKLDYLNRDAFFCGVPYGLQDVDFILTKIRITEDKRLGILSQGTGSIEHLLFSKYLMYRNIYWNRHVRSATSMIGKAVWMSLSEGSISPEELYHLDDNGFIEVMDRAGTVSRTNTMRVVSGRLFPECSVLEMPQISGCIEPLRDHGCRFSVEEQLRDYLNRTCGTKLDPWDVIIDVPESISFESDLPILEADGQQRPFSSSDTVFNQDMIRLFTKKITAVRVFLRSSCTMDEQAIRIITGTRGNI